VNYLSVCSGIEAATVAWHPIGWTPVAFSEIEAFPSAVLAHHYPDTPNLGDMERFDEWPESTVDVLVGGTPCQSFSVAGLRRGLDDPRGNLTLVYLGIAERYRPRWLVWENVPGVLSSDGGRAFGAFLGGLEKLGYGWAYRTLDAQYFGLAQRRRRVFVVASLGGWAAAGSVLFEPESLRGDSAPRREAGERVAGDSGRSVAGRGWPSEVASALNAHYGDKQGLEDQHALNGAELFVPARMCLNAGGMGRQDGETETLIPFDTTQVTSEANYSRPRAGDPRHPLAAGAHAPAVAFHTSGYGAQVDRYKAATLQASDARLSNQVSGVIQGKSVRRLTPRECERLQGFPDDYTAIPYRGKPAADGPRYKALGNSMAVPCMKWIGRRIQAVDAELA